MSLPAITKTRRLSRRDSCVYLEEEWGVIRTPGTLANQAVSGEGPEFQKDGERVTHTLEALDEYAAKQLSQPVKSTAELREIIGDAASPQTGAV